jgi:hypothetical protein
MLIYWFLYLLCNFIDTWSIQYTNKANLLLFLPLFINTIIYSSILWVAGILKDEYKLLAILSVLLVITYILNSERGASVTLVIKRYTTRADAVLWSRSRNKWSMFVYSGFYSFNSDILSMVGYNKF